MSVDKQVLSIVRQPMFSSLKRPWHDRLELYRLYIEENKSIRQIARLYGVSRPTISRWMNKHGIARRDLGSAIRLGMSSPEVRKRLSIKLQRKFMARPSPALGYVLGVVLGDGYVCKLSKFRNHWVGLGVKAKPFVEKFARMLRSIGLRPSRIYVDKKGLYHLRATSVDFYEWFKLLDLEKIRTFIRGFEKWFVCGIYESEGSISERNDTGELYIRIYNKRKELLSMIQEILKDWNIESRLYGPDKTDCFILYMYGNGYVKKFLCVIKPCIKTNPRTRAHGQVNVD